VQLIHERCARYGIDAQWSAGHAHVPLRPRQVRELKEWQQDLAQNYGYATEWWQPERLREVLASERYLGARPAQTFATGIRKTVQSYLDNAAWVAAVQSGAYREWIATQYAQAA